MNERDTFREMWEQQLEFMRLLQKERNWPNFPVDITSKDGQKLLADISHHCTDELMEARQHLKNAKTHRVTEIKEIDRSAYVEELCDALHLFFEMCIASGISVDELYEAYMKKGTINTARILGGY